MNKKLIDILCCPICKKDLHLTVEKEEKDEIIKGIFTCKKCNKIYKISDGVPALLPK